MNTKFLCSLFVALFFATTAAPMAFPLHAAAENGDVKEVVRLLTEKICSVDDRNGDGFTALHCAVRYGWLDCVKKLLERGADVETQFNNIRRYVHIFRMFDEEDICYDWHQECDDDSNNWWLNESSAMTALHFAARGGYLECVKYLVYEARANVEAKNGEGKTPKDLAAENGRQSVVDFFDSYQELPTIKGAEIGEEY
ncbi:ankyrin repeat domain-containing protein [bacterium]|nr:MAG: ankyrin repeat domain-containing protein [bacterium]